MHVTGGDNTNQRFLTTKCEYHMQQPPGGSPPESMVAALRLAMPRIWNNDQRIREEHRFCLSLRYAVLLSAFSGVAFVPVKAFHTIQFIHWRILLAYTP